MGLEEIKREMRNHSLSILSRVSSHLPSVRDPAEENLKKVFLVQLTKSIALRGSLKHAEVSTLHDLRRFPNETAWHAIFQRAQSNGAKVADFEQFSKNVLEKLKELGIA